MKKQQLIEKYEKELEHTYEVVEKIKKDYQRMIFLSKCAAIEDFIADLKKLNEGIHSEARHE